jgi:flavorubredoxin
VNRTLADGIDWVGYVDWEVRDFHGYRTERGTSYNAYLIRDEKWALIDSVKGAYAHELLEQIRSFGDPSRLDYIVCNHAEPDHSSALPEVVRACPKAEVVCDAKCRAILSRYYDTAGWRFRVVADGDRISLGRRSLTFIETPMVHWPESMFTYVPEEKLLFSMDAFGQHYAAANRFDDEEPMDVIMAEAKTYYANIVMMYGKPIARVLERAQGLDISMIAPSHGVIWRRNLDKILAAYADWTTHRMSPKIVIIYDTMWRSTELMAHAILDGALERPVQVVLFNVRSASNTVIATEVMDAAAVVAGSATLNLTLMPEVAATLTYLKGLRPVGKAGFAFGSCGWAGGGARDVEEYLKAMKFDLLREPLECKFVPDDDTLKECRRSGRELADKVIQTLSRAG